MTTIKISLGLNVQVENGPQISFSNPLQVDAYDHLDIELPAKPAGAAVEKEVDLQPSAAERVKFLLIKPKISPVTNLEYKVSDGTDDTSVIALDEPHLYSAGMIKKLFAKRDGTTIHPKVLKFTNKNEKPIAIEILVGRDATS